MVVGNDIAIARNDKNRLDLVRGASSHSDPMYEIFRETGVFVGTDSKYGFFVFFLYFSFFVRYILYCKSHVSSVKFVPFFLSFKIGIIQIF